MNGFYLGALIVAFGLLLMLSIIGKGILNHWQTPVSAADPAAIAQPLVPVPPQGGVRTESIITQPTAQPVVVAPAPVAPAQPVTVVPVQPAVVTPAPIDAPGSVPPR